MESCGSSNSLQQLRTPVQYLKGVGPRRAEMLQRLQITTAADLLFFFPRDYEHLSPPKTVDDLVEGESATLIGTVIEVSQRKTRQGKSIVSALFEQPQGHFRTIWFNQPFMRQQLSEGQRFLVTGDPKNQGLTWQLVHPKISEYTDEEVDFTGRILPVYRLTEGISQSQMRVIVHAAVQKFTPFLEEVLPEDFRVEHQLWPIEQALPALHRPADDEELLGARRRFVYQELLVLQLALALRRQRIALQFTAPRLPVDARLHARITSRFPFDLTADQLEAIREITSDMSRAEPMNRLLQGDVGSGKTIVAIYAMMAAVAHGKQAVLMAPTEVLARQHFGNLSKLLHNSRLKLGLLVGGIGKRERQQLLDDLSSGASQIIVGTQAIIQEGVEFDDLGLVIVDEQHKFGVRQRHTLKTAGQQPHYLVMTATPIPRTHSMTLFGDLDVSTIRERPPGRRNVHTYIGTESDRESWWRFFRKKLREGRQGYVITPLVEDNANLDLVSVETAFEELANGELADFRIDLLHGRMRNDEKSEIMYRFATGETQVLVATSVVEVGVDVPNATLMTIESSERFGLSQLHQLRGRVSRGKFDGYVCAFARESDEEINERLQAFASTTDGFELAELDFRLRGPGNLLGTRQHGMPPLLIADLFRDVEVLLEARRDALEMIQHMPDLDHPDFAKLKQMVMKRYAQVLELGDVG